MPNRDDLRQSARDVFVPLADQAGIDPTAFAVRAEWIKDDANRLHIFQRYDGPDGACIVLKHALRPVDTDGFRDILEAHQTASTALSGHAGAGVPEVLAFDVTLQSYLMSFVPGETFLKLCRQNENHEPFLHAAGAWLGAYHTATFEQERPFQPKFKLRHMHQLSDQMERGERKVFGQKRLISLARDMGACAQEADGPPGNASAKYSDLNAHNILIDGACAVALDFWRRRRHLWAKISRAGPLPDARIRKTLMRLRSTPRSSFAMLLWAWRLPCSTRPRHP